MVDSQKRKRVRLTVRALGLKSQESVTTEHYVTQRLARAD